MKKYICVVFSFIFFVSHLFGQEQKNDYYNYYLNIYKAEEKICENKIDSALVFYNKAFQDYDNKFYFDLYNASICASKTYDYNSLDKTLRWLCSYGYDIDFINKEKLNVLDSLNNYQFYKILEQLKADFENNIDTTLETECILRVENDQTLDKQRINDGKVESLKLFNNVTYENIEWLVHIIDSCGYPNRKLIGYSYEPAYSVVGIMVIHFYQYKARKAFPNLKLLSWDYQEDSIINKHDSIPVLQILSKEVKKGNMYLGEHVKLHNWARTIADGKFFYKKYYNSDKCPPIFDSEKDSLLINYSYLLHSLITEFKKNNESVFILGKSLYKLETIEDRKKLFDSKFIKN